MSTSDPPTACYTFHSQLKAEWCALLRSAVVADSGGHGVDGGRVGHAVEGGGSVGGGGGGGGVCVDGGGGGGAVGDGGGGEHKRQSGCGHADNRAVTASNDDESSNIIMLRSPKRAKVVELTDSSTLSQSAARCTMLPSDIKLVHSCSGGESVHSSGASTSSSVDESADLSKSQSDDQRSEAIRQARRSNYDNHRRRLRNMNAKKNESSPSSHHLSRRCDVHYDVHDDVHHHDEQQQHRQHSPHDHDGGAVSAGSATSMEVETDTIERANDPLKTSAPKLNCKQTLYEMVKNKLRESGMRDSLSSHDLR